MVHSAFHLYFGALDIILYAAAFLVFLSVSRAICDDMDAPSHQTVGVTITTEASTASSTDSSSFDPAPSPSISAQVQPFTSDNSAEGDETASVSQGQESSSRPKLNLSSIKLFKLRRKSVVKLSDLAFSVPETVKRYKLRREDVIKLTDLESFAEVIP